IRGLQPYFASHSVIFADHMPELRQQLLGFPTGFIDAPNALAYLLVMKLGVPIYDNFTDGNIDSGCEAKFSQPVFLLVNTNNQVTTAILAQHQAGRLIILWDLILDGDPGTVLYDLLQSALTALPSLGVSSLTLAERSSIPLRLFSSPRHFDEHTIFGLRAAARKLGYELERGGDPATGREEIRHLFRRVAHGASAISVDPSASWTLRAFAGGYAREATQPEPLSNAYSILMEPLEAFAATLRLGNMEVANPPNYAFTRDGRRYLSALVRPDNVY